ncbi:MAG: tetratricopeptide repeat-containing glycosyltransferase family protein [Pseudomonadota bacterium]
MDVAEAVKDEVKPQRHWRDAVREARQRLKANPNDQEAGRALCAALIRGNRHRDVAAAAKPFIKREDCDAHILFHFAVAADACNDKSAAVLAYRRCVKAKPDWAEAWLNLSAVAKNQNLIDEAIRAAEKGIALKPEMPEGHNNLGQALMPKNRYEEALAAYNKAIELKPDYARAHANRAQALLKLERPDEAEEACREAITVNPEGKEGYTNLAVVLLAQGKVRDAMENCAALAKLYPDDPEVLSNWGVAMKESGFVEEALNRQAQAQAIAPNNPTPKWNEAHARLLIGDYAVGLERYESRWGTPEFKASLRPFKENFWNGERLGTKILLIHLEQGVGDTVQFCRYIPILAEKHPQAEIVVEVQPSLKEILKHSFRHWPRILVRPHASIAGINLPPFDTHVPMGHLLRICNTRIDTIPSKQAYMEPMNPRTYKREGDEMVIGISWKSKGTTGRKRSVTLERLATLCAKPGVRLVDLQYGDTEEERKAVTEKTGIEVFHDDVDPVADLGAFADQVAGCDLVISIDNTTVHIAGAIGVPAWVILPHVPDWRWLLQREDTPWYPSLRLFRVLTAEDWETPLQQVEEALDKLLAGDTSQLEAPPWEGPSATKP